MQLKCSVQTVENKQNLAGSPQHFKEKEFVKSRGRELRNTSFGMDNQFPPEINARRKILYPITKHTYLIDCGQDVHKQPVV